MFLEILILAEAWETSFDQSDTEIPTQVILSTTLKY